MTVEYSRKAVTIHATSPNGFQVAFELDIEGSLIAAAEELTAELLKRGYTPAAAPSAPASSAAAPTCPVHHKPMKPMTKPDRQGRTHWCTAKSDDGFCQERA